MKASLSALLTFALITTSSTVYKCLDSAPYLYCCKDRPFGCQILRDPNQDPAKPPGASYQPADLTAFAAACVRIGQEWWPACCYVDSKITSCNRAFNFNNPRQNLKIAK